MTGSRFLRNRCVDSLARLPMALLIVCGCTLCLFARPAGSMRGRHPRSMPSADQKLVILNSSVTILEPANEAEPIQLAALDLASDFQKVFGKRPRIIAEPQFAGPTVISIGEAAQIPEAMRPSGLSAPESFSISAHETSLNGHPANVILLAGADMRGTIYAIYEFSQEYLGVDPMYYWTDNAPAHRSTIAIPVSLDRKFPPPVFKYRGLFINDEDLLTGWAPGEKKDHTGIALAVWNKIYETILRLKGNMVAPGTWIFPDDPQVKLAARRGLIITQHHAIPLGLNVARWPKDVPYNYTTHPEILDRAWKDAVNSYLPSQEVLWTVGLRGLSDVTYASMDPTVRGNDQALGSLITKAVANQIQIVRSVRPNAQFITSLWQEGARLMRQGDLQIPPEVSTVWADDGYGYLQDHGEVTAGQGAYDHVAMMNGRANQLTEMVPVERSFSEMGRYIKAGATNYFLVNTSDIRPVTMSVRAVMDAAWKGVPSGADPAGKFYEQWTSEEFGAKAAPELTDLYKQYFAAPAHFGDPVHEYGDQLYHTEARLMLLRYMIDSPLYALPSQSPKWEQPHIFGFRFGPGAAQPTRKEWLDEVTQREIQQCSDAQTRWDAVWKRALAIEPLINEARRPFYDEQVLAMIAINRESNRILLLVSKAIRNAESGNTAKARMETNQALSAFAEIQRAESAAEYGKWKQWYRGDWLTGVYRTRQIVQTFSKFLDDPEAQISPPVLWDGWEAYYHIMHYEGDRTADVQ